ncbi:MAG: hypothetical protein QGH11_05970, partial [Pirellulaceae bacterium]|nr:hypothetical protein [Pirellulaceae bacterium]
MPATEQTWRNQKKLHVIFGVSSVVLLLSTLWMFKADHQREWKEYQRTGRTIDVMMTEWRKLAFEQNDYLQRVAELEKAAHVAGEVPIDGKLLVQFESLAGSESDISLTAREDFRQAVASHQGAGAVREARELVFSAMETVIQEVRFREDLLLNDRKFRSADLDKAKADYGLAIRDAKSQQVLEQLKAAADSIEDEVTALNLDYERFSKLRIDLQGVRKQASADQQEAEKAVSDARTGLEQLDTTIRERHAGWVEGYWLGKRWLELPIVDAFNTPLKISNNWSDDLEQDYSHRRVRRFDRCATCHQMMEKTLPGSATNAAYMKERLLQFDLQPGSPPVDGEREGNVIARLSRRFGFSLAGGGLIDRDDVTISYVTPASVAATAVVKMDPMLKRFDGDEVMLSLLKVSSDASPVRPDELARDSRPGLEAGDVI